MLFCHSIRGSNASDNVTCSTKSSFTGLPFLFSVFPFISSVSPGNPTARRASTPPVGQLNTMTASWDSGSLPARKAQEGISELYKDARWKVIIDSMKYGKPRQTQLGY